MTWLRALARSQHLLAAVVLAAALAVFFSSVALDDATFSTVEVNQRNTYPWAAGAAGRPSLPAQADQAQYSHPRQVFLDTALKEDGVIPLWDPLTLGGHPAFASGPGLAYPPRLLLTLLFGPSWTHDLYVILHLFAAGLAMFALMKQLGVGFLGALLAAVAWPFSSYSLGWITLEPFAAVAALLPLALLFVRRWHDRRSWPQLLLASLLLGMLYLGSSSELALVSFVVVAGYAGSLALSRVGSEWRRRPLTTASLIVAPGVLVLVALAVAAVGVLPFLELIGRVDRTGLRYSEYLSSTYPTIRRTSPADFLHALVPPATPLTADSLISKSTFVGTATALLALPALFLRRPGTGLGRAAAVGTLLFVVGTPVTWIGFHLVPGLGSLNGLARTSFVWALGVAILGGIGLDAAWSWLGGTGDQGWRSGLARRLPLALGALGLLCIAGTAGQLAVHGRNANPGFQHRDPATLFPATPAVAAIRQAQGPAPGERRALPLTRLVGGGPPPDGSPFLAMAGNAGQALGLRLVTGYENAVPDRTLQLWRYVRGEERGTVLSEPPTTTLNLVFPSDQVRTELLARLGIGTVFAPPGLVADEGWRPPDLVRKGFRQVYLGDDGVVLEVVDPAPRASVVSGPTVVQGGDEALTALVQPGFDPTRSVILESPPGPAAADGPSGPGGDPRVVWLTQGPNGGRLSVTAAEPGWLVVLESWDPGWRATVDGRATDVERANFAFQAIRIPAGTSAVELRYRPPEVLWGGAVSGMSTAAILVVTGVDAGRRRRRRARSKGSRRVIGHAVRGGPEGVSGTTAVVASPPVVKLVDVAD